MLRQWAATAKAWAMGCEGDDDSVGDRRLLVVLWRGRANVYCGGGGEERNDKNGKRGTIKMGDQIFFFIVI